MSSQEVEKKNPDTQEIIPMWLKRALVLLSCAVTIFLGIWAISRQGEFSAKFIIFPIMFLVIAYFDSVRELSIGGLRFRKGIEKRLDEITNQINSLNVLNVQANIQQNVTNPVPVNSFVGEFGKDLKEVKEMLSTQLSLKFEKEELEQKVRIMSKIISELLMRNEMWEFNYLNGFLVFNTKNLLTWLREKGAQKVEQFNAQARNIGILINNVDITRAVLEQWGLIEYDPQRNLIVSEKGGRFLDSIGFKY